MSEMSAHCGLSYYLPEPVKPHTVLKIPGSHTLFVGPPSCGRRHAFHFMEHGNRSDVTFLFLSESDVAMGSYEELIYGAVGELIEVLPDTPRIFFITVFCIDDFIGTDESALLDTLRTRFPDRQFSLSRVNPVKMGIKQTMGGKKHINMYSFLEPAAECDNGVNFFGNFVSLDPGCEFLQLLKSCGIDTVREIFTCKTYEQYQEMAKSRLIIVLRFIAEDAAEAVRTKLGIPYYYFPTSYDADFIMRGYEDISRLLGAKCPDFTRLYDEAVTEAEETAKKLAGLPIALDAGAFLTPFSTARALINYGFNVRYILRSRHKFDADAVDRDFITGSCPEIKIMLEDEFMSSAESSGEVLAIGADALRVLGAKYFADVWHDEGYFGFQGIRKLMALLWEAVL